MVRQAAVQQSRVRYRVPPVEIVETPEAVILRAEMPGVAKEDFDIRIENDELSIGGKRKHRDSELKFVHVESDQSDYRRTFVLSDELDTMNINAKLEKGVLTLTLGKKKEVMPHKVTVAVD